MSFRFQGLFIPGLLIWGFSLFLQAAEPAIVHDWGPFFAQWTDVHDNERSTILGPVRDEVTTPEGWHFQSWRPLWVNWNHEGDTVNRYEAVWPLWTMKRRGNQRTWRFILNFGTNWDIYDPNSRWRLWIMPFFFQGRDIHGEDYMALFPLWGTIREFFFWDSIQFRFWPIYTQSKMNENTATTWFWPILSRTKGPHIDRFRVFPLYGYSEHHRVGRKTFIMWPFWTSVRYTAPAGFGGGWILFPITGHVKLANQETFWFLPPIFRITKGEEQTRFFGPWPIVQQGKGQVDKFYLFPLFGSKTIGSVEKNFFLWPLFTGDHIEGSLSTKRRSFILGFLYQYFRETPHNFETHPELDSTWTKVWPFFTHLTKEQGRIQKTVIPEFNVMRDGPIERNYAPFWQLYVREQVGEDVDTRILWGLWRSASRGEEYKYRSLFPLVSWSREEDGGHWSIGKGLISRRVEDGKKSWRLLYLFRFGHKEESDAQP